MVISIIVVLLSIIFAFLSQGYKKTVDGKWINIRGFKPRYFILSFLVLGLFCFCVKSGKDITPYVSYYNSWTIKDIAFTNYEPLYVAISLLLRIFIKNPYIGIGVIKLLSLLLVYASLYLLKDKINLGIATTAYIVLLYIYNFHLLRMMLALGMVFLALSLDLTEKTRWSYLLFIVAFMIHYTSIIVFVVFLCYKIFFKKINIVKQGLILGVLLLFYANFNTWFSMITSYESFLSKYQSYVTDQATSGTGLVQIIMFIPILTVLYLEYKYSKETRLYKLGFLLGIMIFFTGSLGYIFPVVSRIAYYFLYFVICYWSMFDIKYHGVLLKFGKSEISLSRVLQILYLLEHITVYFIVGNGFVSNGLDKIIYIWS